MTKIRRELFVYIGLDILLIAFSLYKGMNFLLNSQVAFLSALFVILMSFLSYIKNINKQIELLGDLVDNRDFIDELDDPYELYEEEEGRAKKSSKAKISMKNLSKSKGAAFSIFRIIGYIVLIAGFMMLVKLHMFLILPYILGISIIPAGTIIAGLVYHRQ